MKKVLSSFSLIVLVLLIPIFTAAETLNEGLTQLSDQITSSMSEGNKQKVAVIEFSDLDGKVTQFGKFVAEELITQLFLSKRFDVVERQLLNKVVDEHKLNLTGLVDETTARELGKILGVDAICSGTITDLINSVKVNARLISTETGSIFGVASAEIQKDEVVKKLMETISPSKKSGGKLPSQDQIRRSNEDITRGAIVLGETKDNVYNWHEGGPYVTSKFAYEGDVAFIPTGNNVFYKELGIIGYEEDEIRYITFKLYLSKKEASLKFQVHINGSWEHRWAFDGRQSYKGPYPWPVRGQTTGLPVKQWVDIKLDLIDDLGGKPGQKLQGIAFSGNDGNLIYDYVVLLPSEE